MKKYDPRLLAVTIGGKQLTLHGRPLRASDLKRNDIVKFCFRNGEVLCVERKRIERELKKKD